MGLVANKKIEEESLQTDRSAKLGIQILKPQFPLDTQKIPANIITKNQLEGMVQKSENYRRHIDHTIFSPENKLKLIKYCELYQQAISFGKATMGLVNRDVETARASVMKIPHHQKDIVQVATLTKVFAEDYVRTNGVSINTALNNVITDQSFIAVISSIGTDQFEENEKRARSKLFKNLTNERAFPKSKAFEFIAQTARQAGFAETAIAAAAQAFGITHATRTIIPRVPSIPMPIAATLQEMQEEKLKKEIEEFDKRKREEKEEARRIVKAGEREAKKKTRA